MRLALFVTCLTDTLFPQTGRATVALLRRLGHEVAFPLEQTCCGQMHANSGYAEHALALARRHARVFADEATIVSPSGSCVAMVREQYPRLAEQAGDGALADELRELAARTFELSELLVDRLDVVDVGASFPHAVVLHPACHARRALGVGDRPRRLLAAVDGLRLLELPDEEQCCGFGGTFAVKNADTSIAMLADKLSAIERSGAEVCVAADNSCLMHIGGGLSRRRAAARTMHLAEVLAATGPATP